MESSRSQSDYTSILPLPPEITIMIFEMASSLAEVDREWSELVKARPEIIISHVCRQWRQVALSCPTIWSRIMIRNWVAGTHSAAQLLEVYLTRSRGVPLDIVVTIRSPQCQLRSCTGDVYGFLRAVLPHSSRWRRPALWIDGGYSITPFACLQEVSVSQLEVFEVATYPPPQGGPFPRSEAGSEFLTLFQTGAPKLSSALMESQLHLPLHHCRNISALDLQNSCEIRPWEDFITLITLPNLTNLTLDDIFLSPVSEPDPFAPPALAPKLRNFRTSSFEVARYMWTTICAPELALLVLFHIGGKVAFSSNEVDSSQGRFPAVETLVLWSVDIWDPLDLTRLALALPYLTSLVICDCGVDNRTLSETLLAQSRAKDVKLWPRLTTLTYVEGSGPGPRFRFSGLVDQRLLSYKKSTRNAVAASGLAARSLWPGMRPQGRVP
ncbi:hypothetical protein D9619_012134 [Psilocybe cf. subviscida]|uniref:F-box domain-containing protein n=1 Tax=Psilocybe cf. subviscida TaxID=2480587 RepID=A0A8H5EZM7_9AGAR|nr:hypothetical protein D9619_012134 [Psilocybe cf. subviscida]